MNGYIEQLHPYDLRRRQDAVRDRLAKLGRSDVIPTNFGYIGGQPATVELLNIERIAAGLEADAARVREEQQARRSAEREAAEAEAAQQPAGIIVRLWQRHHDLLTDLRPLQWHAKRDSFVKWIAPAAALDHVESLAQEPPAIETIADVPGFIADLRNKVDAVEAKRDALRQIDLRDLEPEERPMRALAILAERLANLEHCVTSISRGRQ